MIVLKGMSHASEKRKNVVWLKRCRLGEGIEFQDCHVICKKCVVFQEILSCITKASPFSCYLLGETFCKYF